MASSFACGHVWTVESHEMAAKLKLIKLDRDMKSWFMALFFDIGHPCYGQLTPVKTRYLLTSII